MLTAVVPAVVGVWAWLTHLPADWSRVAGFVLLANFCAMLLRPCPELPASLIAERIRTYRRPPVCRGRSDSRRPHTPRRRGGGDR